MDMGRYVVEAVVVEGRRVAEVARAHGVHRSWIYKLLARYRQGGFEALEPRSRRPHSSPNQIPAEVEDRIVFIRKTLSDEGLDAGGETILYHLSTKMETPPSLSTIWRVLRRRGFVSPQPKKRPRSAMLRFEADLPNECWQSDFTHWQLQDGTDVEILNFLDDHSRLVICSRVVGSTNAQNVVETFQECGKRYGLPASVLTDNGRVYTTSRYGNKVLFELFCDREGIVHKRSTPYHPQTCGKVERFHQTLKKYLANQPPAIDCQELQQQIDRFVRYYNDHRPHRGIGRQIPRKVYEQKIKARPADQKPKNNFRVRRDRVDKGGKLTLRHNSELHHIGIGRAFGGQRVTMLICDLDVRVIDSNGELIRHLILDPSTTNHPRGGP